MTLIRSVVFGLVMLLTACPIAAQTSQADSGEEVVAVLGDGGQITWSELAEYMQTRPDLAYRSDKSAAYREALDALIAARLKRVDLFESGLARDSVLRERLERNVTEELVLAYGKDQYEDRYLNEETIRAEHEAMGRVLVYRQIVLNKPRGASGAVLDSLRAVANRMRQEVADGVPFGTVVQRFSQAYPSLQARAGESSLNWKHTVKSPRSYILFHLSPGDVRGFEGPNSFSVAQIERVEQTPVPPLEEVRERIVDALHGWHAAKATDAFQKEWMALVDTTALRWNPEALEQVVVWSNMPGFYEGDYRSTITQYLAGYDDAQVLTDGRGGVNLSDLPRLFDEVLTLSRSGGRKTEFIKDFLLEAVRTERLAERARALGLDEKIWHPNTASPVLANEFVRYYNQKRIESRIPEPTEAALRDFYEAYHDSLFYQLARVNTEIIVRSDEGEIEALWDEVQQGVPFEEVSHRRLNRVFERTRDGEIVTQNTRREPPYLGEIAFGLEEGEVAGPVAYEDAKEGQLYAIVLATRRLPERQLAFEEVRDHVAEAFLKHSREKIEAEVVKDLSEKYDVAVYTDVLERRLANKEDSVRASPSVNEVLSEQQ